MWDGSDERDAGAEMFSNLSVNCCMSPTGADLQASAFPLIAHRLGRMPRSDDPVIQNSARAGLLVQRWTLMVCSHATVDEATYALLPV